MSVPGELQRVDSAAKWLQDKLGAEYVSSIRLGLVLGSGLKSFAGVLTNAVEIPFDDVPEWPKPKA